MDGRILMVVSYPEEPMNGKKPMTALVVLSAMVVSLWGIRCIPKKKQTVYKCTACFKDKPTQCAVDDQSLPSGEARGELDARKSARVGLCGQLDMNLKAEIACYDRPLDDFNITCTSSIAYKSVNPGCYVN